MYTRKLTELSVAIACFFCVESVNFVFQTKSAIAQQTNQQEVQETCKAKASGISKSDYLSEYPTQEDINKAKPEDKTELQNLLKEKERISKIWDGCGK